MLVKNNIKLIMELDKIQTVNLRDQKFLEELTQQVDDYVRWDKTFLAWKLFLKIKEIFEKDSGGVNNKLINKYIYLLRRLKFLALPLLSDEETINLFEKDLAFAWQLDSFTDEESYDFNQKLKYKLTSVLLWERDEFKIRLINAMKNNQQRISSESIELGSGHQVAPTMANWLKDYIDRIGIDTDTLKQTNYLINSLNTKKLTDDERSILRQVIHLYEKLKISSATPEGIEEDLVYIDKNGQMKILHNGQFINFQDLNKK